MKMPSRVILPLAWRSAEQETPSADRQRGAMARQADDAHIMAEIFAAELGANAHLLGQLVDFGLHLEIAEGMGQLSEPCCRQGVEIAGRRRAWRSSAPARPRVPPMTMER